jgi:transposase
MTASVRRSNGQFRSRLTAEVAATICDALLSGSTQETAAAYASVPASTYWQWLKNGRNGGSLAERRFAADVEKAIATFKVGAAAKVAKSQDWRAQAWLLERRFPQDFGQVQRVEVDAQVSHSMKLDLGSATDAELAALKRLMQKQLDGDGDVIELPAARRELEP